MAKRYSFQELLAILIGAIVSALLILVLGSRVTHPAIKFLSGQADDLLGLIFPHSIAYYGPIYVFSFILWALTGCGVGYPIAKLSRRIWPTINPSAILGTAWVLCLPLFIIGPLYMIGWEVGSLIAIGIALAGLAQGLDIAGR